MASANGDVAAPKPAPTAASASSHCRYVLSATTDEKQQRERQGV